jgi:hypothetical protein
VLLLGNCLIGLFVRAALFTMLMGGATLFYLGYSGDNFVFLALGGVMMSLVAVVWSIIIERDNERRMNHPLHLE